MHAIGGRDDVPIANPKVELPKLGIFAGRGIVVNLF